VFPVNVVFFVLSINLVSWRLSRLLGRTRLNLGSLVEPENVPAKLMSEY
jgi:hypothetical protein